MNQGYPPAPRSPRRGRPPRRTRSSDRTAGPGRAASPPWSRSARPVEPSAQVADTAVGEDQDHDTFAQALLYQLIDPPEREPRRVPGQDTFLAGQPPGQIIGGPRRASQVAVRHAGVVDPRHNRGRHVLEALQAMEGVLGLEADAADGGIELLQPTRGPDEGPRGPKTGQEDGDLPLGLLPDLHRGGVVVGAPIEGVVVLIGAEVAVRASGLVLAAEQV